ncbi:MAG: FtsX-like permease family protein, partial [Bacteroidota bacterium]
IISGIIGLLLLSGLIAGSYPALYISSFRPVDIFRGDQKKGNKGVSLRKGLVIFQFILSIILIFGTLVLSTQLSHMQNAPLGYDKNQVVTFPTGNRIKSISSFKNSLLGYKDILNVTGTMIPPFRLNMMAGDGQVHWEGQEHTKTPMVLITVDADYTKTFGLKIVNGRFFSSDLKTDLTNAWVVNETAVKTMGMDSPIGKWLEALGEKKVIIGVVKDYNFEKLQEKIRPMAMKLSLNNQWICIKIKNNNIPATLKYIETQWKQHSNNFPFEFNFLDDQINNLYITEQRMGTMFKYFGILAIILSCLGMFGLASFLSQSRTKEIGIRKVLGSKITGLIILLSKDFIKWVCYAMIIAWPIAWFLMNKSLQIYAYKIKIGWEFFVISGGLALIIAVFSIGYQVFQTARINPIKALRHK